MWHICAENNIYAQLIIFAFNLLFNYLLENIKFVNALSLLNIYNIFNEHLYTLICTTSLTPTCLKRLFKWLHVSHSLVCLLTPTSFQPLVRNHARKYWWFTTLWYSQQCNHKSCEGTYSTHLRRGYSCSKTCPFIPTN